MAEAARLVHLVNTAQYDREVVPFVPDDDTTTEFTLPVTDRPFIVRRTTSDEIEFPKGYRPKGQP